MLDDISFLVQETFKDVEKGEKKGFFASFMGEKIDLPESSGVLYHLQQNASTFVIRIHPCRNLNLEHKNISNHPDLFPGLRLNHELIEAGELKYFECDSYDMALNLKETLANKRYPLFEENVFNVSDPGDSWWLGQEPGKVRIYFKLSRTENLSRLIKLGPLGDGRHYEELFMKLRGYFGKLFPLNDYASGYGQIDLSCEDADHPMFRSFAHLLSHGEVTPEFFQVMGEWERSASNEEIRKSVQKANFIMIELATIRNFWLSIEDQLLD